MKSLNKQPSESSVYIWNIVGSIANALLSVVLLMMVTRTFDVNRRIYLVLRGR